MEDELWSSLLEQVSSRSNNQKQVVLLGAPGTGQSTLVSLLKGKQRSSLDLGLSYEYLDVKDAADEGGPTLGRRVRHLNELRDLLARIGLYGLRSPDRPLLQLALTPATLSDSLVVILLDWQQPWSFVSQLAFWFRLLQSVLQQDAPAHQDRIEAFLKAYQEPVLKEDGSVGTTPQPARDAAEAASLPLPFGTLSVNLGLPVVVVCTKVRFGLINVSWL
jgi:dynein light intermediate chain 1